MIVVSIIIPVFNEELTIVELLKKINAQSLDGFELEVIVIDPGGERIEIPTLLDDDTREKLLKEIKDMAGPTYNIVSEQGYLRNVYFHHSFLEEAFEKAGTIKEGIMSVWNTFSSEFGGIYDFIIDYDDKEGRLLIRDKGFSEKRVETVLENKSTDDDYNLGNPGVYVFPVWEKNSMVKSQNLSAKLPSRMQVAAMYGANNAEKFGDGNIENYDDCITDIMIDWVLKYFFIQIDGTEGRSKEWRQKSSDELPKVGNEILEVIK